MKELKTAKKYMKSNKVIYMSIDMHCVSKGGSVKEASLKKILGLE